MHGSTLMKNPLRDFTSLTRNEGESSGLLVVQLSTQRCISKLQGLRSLSAGGDPLYGSIRLLLLLIEAFIHVVLILLTWGESQPY